jgi:CheY-like chemotaxis protein
MDDFAAAQALRAHEKGLEFISTIDPQTPTLLRGDPGRLRQILTNLVGNAVKFTERGEVFVKVSGEQSDGQTVLLRFTVRDTGIGIPEDKVNLLFNKFSQVDASVTRKFGGTGLGLAISKQLAEMMGGQVGVRGTPDQGSEFWFTARLVVQEATDEAPPRAAVSLAGLHVLVVDDNATNLQILMKQLTAWGMRAQAVPGGAEALRAAAKARDRSDPFDLAVVDFQMPGMDGAELGKRLKADPRFQAIPLVMLTSLGQSGDARMHADPGFSAYLNKPVRESDLYDALAMAMADTGERAPSRPIITRHLAQDNQRRQATSTRFSGRVLVAEDNAVNQRVALGMLRNLGLHADAAANGCEALHALRTLPYDLVLMDVQMPEMDGLEATRRIRKEEGERFHPSRRLPVIAMTAGAMARDRESCFEAGMDDFLAKPVKPEELARVLGRWMESDGRQESGVGSQEGKGCGRQEAQIDEGTGKGEADLGFDRAALLERCMGDENLVQDLLKLFLETMPQCIQELQAALDAGDAPAARMAAHTIKGVAANSSAGALRALAEVMECAAQDGDLEAARGRMERLKMIFGRLRTIIEAAL